MLHKKRFCTVYQCGNTYFKSYEYTHKSTNILDDEKTIKNVWIIKEWIDSGFNEKSARNIINSCRIAKVMVWWWRKCLRDNRSDAAEKGYVKEL